MIGFATITSRPYIDVLTLIPNHDKRGGGKQRMRS
jgi:hypothetical protein